ncbi:FimV/HubP family polar landmark protein [Shewanella sp. KJ2020]|uniref:FimV/HubP family polar landmark protein n=1 Tax=Shewanella sp. KJ2020 TaxID=2919172 RepID=UPI0020A78F5E|nr:FimV/HubP family polar landmark protein [Shewanella sp. KJ2020]MCP3128658.1 fimbrial protein FimV [Shewanella sp. KJ2020]
MTKIARLLGLLALMCSATAVAQVSHVSINSRMFELGAYPKMRLNVITDNQDMTRLEFVVHQSTGEEKLMAQQLNRFLILLTGVEDVTDPKALLLVREYRVDRWFEVKSLPVFGADKTPAPEVVESKPATTQITKPVVGSTAKTTLAGAESTAMAPIAAAATDTANTDPSPKGQSTLMDAPLTPNDKPSPSTALASEECVLNYAANETLWRIANRYAAQWEVNMYGAMLAIYDANPKAFAKNKINALKKNATLYCPSKEMLTRYADAGEAKTIFEDKSGG